MELTNTATCACCGCTDRHACEGGCFWLAVDRASRSGICSNCAGALDRWMQHRQPLSRAARGPQPRSRFRWTRRLYREATSLARFLDRYPYHELHQPPPLVQRLIELWDLHPQANDPLLRPLWQRHSPDDLPF